MASADFHFGEAERLLEEWNRVDYWEDEGALERLVGALGHSLVGIGKTLRGAPDVLDEVGNVAADVRALAATLSRPVKRSSRARDAELDELEEAS